MYILIYLYIILIWPSKKKNLKIFQFEYMIINTLPKHRIENKILEGVLDVEVTNPQLYELNTYE